MEEKYWELREAMDRAWDEYMRDPDPIVKIEYDYAYDRFADFCMKILEKLMDENSEILANLKNI